MIKILICLFGTCLACFGLPIFAQQPKPLSIGDRVPDVSLGTDFVSGESLPMLSELTGKLVILDFWNSACASCIAGFPKMEQLQRQFGEDIQIILVNAEQDSAQLAKAMSRRYLKKRKLPQLPISVGAGHLRALFPFQAVPHHVWIGTDGRVLLMGASLNTYASKIESALSGKPFYILNNSNTSEPIPQAMSLMEIAEGEHLEGRGDIRAFITGFQNEYSPLSPKALDSVTLKGSSDVKDTYLNYEMAELFRVVFDECLYEQNRGVVYGGPFSYGTTQYWMNYLEVIDVDTLQLTSAFVPNGHLTDSLFIRNRYSYEQNTPQGLLGLRKQRMFEILNEYLQCHFGIRASLVCENVEAFVMVYQGKYGVLKSEEGYPLKGQLSYGLNKLMDRMPNIRPRFVIDRTGRKYFGDMGLTAEFTWEEMVSALSKQGVHIIRDSVPLHFLRFEQN